MKITQMTVEGARGEARLSRVDGNIRIEAKWLGRIVPGTKRDMLVFETAVLDVAASSDEDRLELAARRLQATLDGYEGTNGDVADYQRAIQ
ncbi:MAG: hypothetical protein NT049_06940, partial [Planctomycetota bacterium]|nr:hypothetical protein [Planctomycetota bacterium]